MFISPSFGHGYCFSFTDEEIECLGNCQGYSLVNGFESHSQDSKAWSSTVSNFPVSSLILFQTFPLCSFVELDKIKKKTPLELLPMYKMIFWLMLQILACSTSRKSNFRIFELRLIL